MSRLGIFFADGCEEIEGLAVVDIIRRAKMDITTISITGEKEVTGSHQITFLTDALFEDVDFSELDGIILPGGMPGTLKPWRTCGRDGTGKGICGGRKTGMRDLCGTERSWRVRHSEREKGDLPSGL